MNKLLSTVAAATALLALPMAANASIFQFTATLNSAQEVSPTASLATGVATLFYNDSNTAITSDDTYSFSLMASGPLFDPTAYHLHQGAIGVNGSVQVNLAMAPFLSTNSGGTLKVDGNNVPTTTTTLLSNLQAGLEYVNIHTAVNPTGDIRGQLALVSAVPEPSTYAMFGVGLALISSFIRRRAHKTA